MAFHVGPLELMLSELQMAHRHKTKRHATEDLARKRHRASHDAWAVQETYNRTLFAFAGAPVA